MTQKVHQSWINEVNNLQPRSTKALKVTAWTPTHRIRPIRGQLTLQIPLGCDSFGGRSHERPEYALGGH